MKYTLIKSFFALHLLIVLLGSGLIKQNNKLAEAFLLRYASYTGGGFGYSFFSPNVGNQTVVKAYTLDRKKQLRQDAYGIGKNLFDSRLSAVIHTFRNQKAYELTSRMIASHVFANRPGTGVTFISIGEYVPPLMKEYRLHQKTSVFREVYNGTYTLQ